MPVESLETLASRMRWARGNNGMTQDELAKAAKTSQSQINSIERGEVTRPRNIADLAKALNVSPAWLQFGEAQIDTLSHDSISLALEYERLPVEAKATVIQLIKALAPK